VGGGCVFLGEGEIKEGWREKKFILKEDFIMSSFSQEEGEGDIKKIAGEGGLRGKSFEGFGRTMGNC